MSSKQPPKHLLSPVVEEAERKDKSPSQSPSSSHKLKQKLSINSQNFVMCRVGKFDEDYTVVGKLGQGAFGTVYRVKHKTLHFQRALKMIKKKGKNHYSTFEEIEVLKKLDHVNILKIYSFYQAPKFYYIVTEIFQGQELFDLLVEEQKLTEAQAVFILKEILGAVNYTHSQKIAHRDLKPENILVRKVNDKYKVKIIDWGLGTLMGDGKANRVCGTPEYAAPEVIKGNYSIACDMWSIGAITYVMLTGEMPFQGKDAKDTMEIVKKGFVKTDNEGFKSLSSDAQNFIISLMNKNQNKRMTAVQALEHPWIVKNTQQPKSPVYLRETLQRLQNFKTESKFGTAIISFINNHFSQEQQLQKLQETFKYLDQNSDGVLSLQQLISGYSNIYGKELAKQIAEQTFNKLDINHNGSLQFSQFVTFGLKQKKEQQANSLKEAFHLFDRDGNGKISKQEIQMILKGKADEDIADDIQELINQIDKNGDQEIDMDEFIKCISSFSEGKQKKKQIRKSPRSPRSLRIVKEMTQI